MEPTAAPTAFDVAAVAGQFPILKREIGGRPLTYLDSGATAQTPEPVLAEMDRIYRQSNANIHRGVYPLAQEATDAPSQSATVARAPSNASVDSCDSG